MKKFIVTRIGLETPAKFDTAIHKENDPYYTLNVIRTMLDFTYYSVRNQTNKKDLVWCFYTGSRFSEEHKKMIQDSIKDINLFFVKDVEYSSTVKPWELCDEYMMIRLDADDYMHPNLLQLVEAQTMRYYNGNNIVICGPKRGYKIFPDGRLMECEYPKIALGLAITSSCGAVAFHNHTKLKEIYEKVGDVVEVPLELNQRLYLYNRSELSHSYTIEGDYKNKDGYLDNTGCILKEFKADETPYIKRLKCM